MQTHTHYLKNNLYTDVPLELVLLLGQGWRKQTAYRSLCPQAKSSQSTGYVSQPASVSVIPALGRLSLQAGEFKVSLGCLNETLSQEAESAVLFTEGVLSGNPEGCREKLPGPQKSGSRQRIAEPSVLFMMSASPSSISCTNHRQR